jgi:hypothetical protein
VFTPDVRGKSFDEYDNDIEDLLMNQYLEPIRVDDWKAVVKPKVKLLKGVRKTDLSLQYYPNPEMPP